MIDYKHNPKLSPEEKWAVEHYRDIGSVPITWKYKPKPHELDNIEMDCLMIGKYLRGQFSKDELDVEDISKIENLISLIQSATTNNKIDRPLLLMKGLNYGAWFVNDYDVGDIFHDNSFGSFTTDRNTAVKYAHDNRAVNEKFLVFWYLNAKSGDKGLYIDNKEHEWLLPAGNDYLVENVWFQPMENNYESINYYIRKVNK